MSKEITFSDLEDGLKLFDENFPNLRSELAQAENKVNKDLIKSKEKTNADIAEKMAAKGIYVSSKIMQVIEKFLGKNIIKYGEAQAFYISTAALGTTLANFASKCMQGAPEQMKEDLINDICNAGIDYLKAKKIQQTVEARNEIK